MADINWHHVKFLESTTNLKNILKGSIGRTASTKVGRQAAVCLQQGRMYFEAAAASPLEIRPLLIFYGMIGFAASLVVARKLKALNTFNRSHGLEDQSPLNVRL